MFRLRKFGIVVYVVYLFCYLHSETFAMTEHDNINYDNYDMNNDNSKYDEINTNNKFHNNEETSVVIWENNRKSDNNKNYIITNLEDILIDPNLQTITLNNSFSFFNPQLHFISRPYQYYNVDESLLLPINNNNTFIFHYNKMSMEVKFKCLEEGFNTEILKTEYIKSQTSLDEDAHIIRSIGLRNNVSKEDLNQLQNYVIFYKIYHKMMLFEKRINYSLRSIFSLDDEKNEEKNIYNNNIIQQYGDKFYNICNLINSKLYIAATSIKNEEERNYFLRYFAKNGIIIDSSYNIRCFNDKEAFKTYWEERILEEFNSLLRRIDDLKVDNVFSFPILQSSLKPSIKQFLFCAAYVTSIFINCFVWCNNVLYDINDEIKICSYSSKYIFDIPLSMCVNVGISERCSVNIIGYNIIPLFFAVIACSLYVFNSNSYYTASKLYDYNVSQSCDYKNTELGYFLFHLAKCCILNTIQLFNINIILFDKIPFTFNLFPIMFFYFENYVCGFMRKHKLLHSELWKSEQKNICKPISYNDSKYQENTEIDLNDCRKKRLITDIEEIFNEKYLQCDTKQENDSEFGSRIISNILTVCGELFVFYV